MDQVTIRTWWAARNRTYVAPAAGFALALKAGQRFNIS
jgi:hypothetical protein